MTPQESNWCGAETAPKPLTLRKTLIRTTEFCKNPWPSFSRTIRRRPASKRRLKVKSRWVIGFLLTCALAISANAQENSGVQSAEGPIANLARQNSGDATSPATQLQAPAGLQDAGTYPDRTTNSGYSLVAPAAPRYSLVATSAQQSSHVQKATSTISTTQSFSQEELDALLAPIALYPDALLSQVLMASTYPLEVVEADCFLKQNPGLSGKALDDELAQKNWDPSVQSLAAYPKVLAMMSEKLEWTERLGDAFLEDKGRVMDTVQALRRRAEAAGNLKSNSEQTVVHDKETIIVEPSQTEYVYVKDDDYDWLLVYGMLSEAAYYDYYYYYHRYYGYASVRVTNVRINDWHSTGYHIDHEHWGWAKADWGNRNLKLNTSNNRFWNESGRTAPAQGSAWQHDPVHRRGVDYPTSGMRDRFAGANPAAGRSLEGGAPSASRGGLPQGPSGFGGPGAGGPSPMGTPQSPSAPPSGPLGNVGPSSGGLPSGGFPFGGLPSGGFPSGGPPAMGPPPMPPPPMPH